jgi:hypothetical protein
MHIATCDDWRRVWPVDLSSHGAHFRGAHLPQPGTRVRVAFRVPCHVLRLIGTVVWNHDPRAAVEFDTLTRAQQLVLDGALLEADVPDGPGFGAILLMIDDPVTQLAIGRAVHGRGYHTIARTTPLDVLQGLMEPGPPLRAAIVSAGLPHGAGQDVLEFLAQERPLVRRALLAEEVEQPARCGRSIPDHVLLGLPYDIALVFAELNRSNDPRHTPAVHS